MSYIDNNLLEGEQVTHRTCLHWIVFMWPVFFFLIPLSLIVVNGEAVAMAMPLAILVGLPWGICSFISLKTTEFGITNRRVMVKTGFIRRNTFETMLGKVEGLHISQGILGRLLNYGTVSVVGTGGSKNAFHKIKAPLELRKKVQEQLAV